jgi:hypothetical protein
MKGTSVHESTKHKYQSCWSLSWLCGNVIFFSLVCFFKERETLSSESRKVVVAAVVFHSQLGILPFPFVIWMYANVSQCCQPILWLSETFWAQLENANKDEEGEGELYPKRETNNSRIIRNFLISFKFIPTDKESSQMSQSPLSLKERTSRRFVDWIGSDNMR